jgi:endoglucanase
LKKTLIIILFLAVLSYSIGPVSYYGKLKVREQGRAFIDGSKGHANVQVRGVSLGWSNTGWESSRFFNKEAVHAMVDDWKAEVIRVPIGVGNHNQWCGCYLCDKTGNMERVKAAIDAALAKDVYVIIDWHSHSAHSSEEEIEAAKDFFEEMAEVYGAYDNIIFELYNEPLSVAWAEIKSYAEQIIPLIRKHSDNLILVGTPSWCQKIRAPIGNTIDDPNVGYVLHFYSRTHSLTGSPSNAWTRDSINVALSAGLPIFVTEYGTTNADGGQPPSNYNSHDAERSDEWHAYMDSRKISSVAWNVNDKYEGSAFFGTVNRWFEPEEQAKPENWSDLDKMTASGQYIFNKLNEYYKCVPWNPNPDASCVTSAIMNISAAFPSEGIFEIYSLQGKKIGEFQGSITDLKLNSGVYMIISRQNGAKYTKILSFFK